MLGNTKTQSHEDTRKGRNKELVDAAFLCGFVPLCLCVSFLIAASPRIHAQGGRGAQPPATARDAALVDFAGYWVSVVTEDWRWRMVTPARGDFASIPLNAAGRKAGEAGTRQRMKRPASSARRTAPAASCGFRDDCTSPGKTTTRCGSIQTKECRLVYCISMESLPKVARGLGRATLWRSGKNPCVAPVRRRLV